MIRLTCVIDNNVKPNSTFQGEHGLCFRIETDSGFLFLDTGASPQVLSHNLDLLPPAHGSLLGLVLSHAHYDHTGGLPTILKRYPGIPIFASPHIFERRFSLREGIYRDIGMDTARQELEQAAQLQLNSQPTMITPGIWTTGEILNRHEPEGRSPRHFVRREDTYIPDPYQDDMSLVLQTPKGLVVICGCCHAGLLNTLAHVSGLFPDPVQAIVGGTHLVEADDSHLQHVIDTLQDTYNRPYLYVNHCTGSEALNTLSEAFPRLTQPCPAGTVLQF
jgi:7,8-dihydropterin-6-yl-methyl-4-(beta-D-ribofuranosyl)aminobenzene 5'-phosphate synthase